MIFSIFYLPTLIFRGKLHRDFLQRFGLYDRKTLEAFNAPGGKIWVQAVSVGEVALCKSFIPLLKEQYPGRGLVLSTITKTGYELARKNFDGIATVIYFPLDFSFVVRRAVRLVRPKLYVMVETEIWPNLLKELARNGVPSVMVNGRISDRSIGKYRLVKPFLKGVLGRIMLFCMRSQVDADRIIGLGAPAERVKITGNMKFDIGPSQVPAQGKLAAGLLGLKEDEKLFVAGSTHPGEEEIVFEAFKAVAKELSGIRLLIAPRHINRVHEIEDAAKRSGLETVRMTELAASGGGKAGQRVLILDTIGQLNDIYPAAALVFIGGSLVRHGGHNPIEPAIFEKAVIFGPYMFNFRDTASVFVRQNAAIQVPDRHSFLEKVRILLKDEAVRKLLGSNAGRVVTENRGATERSIRAIKEVAR